MNTVDEFGKEVIDLWNDMQDERRVYEKTYTEIARYVIPSLGTDWNINRNNRGPERATLYDDTAVHSNRILANGLMGNLVSPALRWMTLWLSGKISEVNIQDIPGASAWLRKCEDYIYGVFASSNFYDQISDFFLQGGSIGTATMWAEPPVVADDRWVFFTLHPKEVWVGENHKKKIDTHIRRFEMQGKDLIERFGKGIAETYPELLREWQETPRKWFQVLHAVFPRKFRDPMMIDKKNKKYASGFVTIDGKTLEEGGMDSSRYLTWRWQTIGDQIYGYSPAMDVMPSIKASQQLRRSLLEASQMMVEPPMNVPESMRNRVNLVPKGLNFYSRADEIIRPIQMTTGYQIGLDREQAIMKQIQDGFYTDLFLMLERNQQRMTAYEVMQRTGEKTAILGPITARLQSEFLDPMVEMVIDEEIRKKRFPAPPPALQQYLQGTKLNIDYTGPIAVAQRKNVIVNGLSQGMQIMAPIAQIRPDVLDNFNFDAWARLAMEGVAAPGEVINDSKSVAAIRQARLKQQQEMMKMQQEQALMQNYKGMAQAPEQGSPGMAIAKAAGIDTSGAGEQ